MWARERLSKSVAAHMRVPSASFARAVWVPMHVFSALAKREFLRQAFERAVCEQKHNRLEIAFLVAIEPAALKANSEESTG